MYQFLKKLALFQPSPRPQSPIRPVTSASEVKSISLIDTIHQGVTLLCLRAVLEERHKVEVIMPSKSQSNLLTFATNLFKKHDPADKLVQAIDLIRLEDPKALSQLTESSVCVLNHLQSLSYSTTGPKIIEALNLHLKKIAPHTQLILNWEDLTLRKWAEEFDSAYVYGFNEAHCHVWVSNLRIQNYQSIFELNYGVERVEVTTKFLGKDQITAMLAAATLGLTLNFPLTTIKKGLEKVIPTTGQMELIEGKSGSLILDDSSSSDPSSWENALVVLNQLPARRRIIVLGEMKDLGSHSEKLHRELAQKIYRERMDIVLTGTGQAVTISQELKQLGFLEDRLEQNLQNPLIVSRLLKILGKGDLVLIKGHPSVRFDEIVKKLALKVV